MRARRIHRPSYADSDQSRSPAQRRQHLDRKPHRAMRRLAQGVRRPLKGIDKSAVTLVAMVHLSAIELYLRAASSGRAEPRRARAPGTLRCYSLVVRVILRENALTYIPTR